MSRILLINPEIPLKRYLTQSEQFPNGALLLLGTILKNKRHEVKIVHMTADNIKLNDLVFVLKEYNPEYVGLTGTTFQAWTLREVSKLIKTIDHNIKVIGGGAHISALISIQYPVEQYYKDIDYFVKGEGDVVFEQIIKGNVIDSIIEAKMLRDINIPHIDLSLVDMKHFTGGYPIGPRPEMFVMGSRGCAFNCTFCSRAVFGKTVRYREPAAVVDDIDILQKKWGIKEVFLQDDTFNLNREWAEELLNMIIKRGLNNKLCFRTPCRVNRKLIDLDLLKLMKQAGFWLIFFGVENGNQDMLKRMNKNITISEIERAFRLSREAGIKTEASFIIGLPGENKKTIEDSKRLLNVIKPDWASFTRAIPFPGTELYDYTKNTGNLLIKDFSDIEVDKVLCRTTELSEHQIEYYAVMLNKIASRQKIKRLMKNPKEMIAVINDIRKSNSIISSVKKLCKII